ncbi:MAG: hypothetical protein SNF33_00115 (plasmid) [Candidatus Algichlamydia australiensis]|nr:hypothetical protein [Chlamydiales bacterium]
MKEKGFDDIGKELKKKREKISFSNYNNSDSKEKGKDIKPKIRKNPKEEGEGGDKSSSKKELLRVGVVLPPEEHKMLMEMYTTGIMNGEKIDRTSLIRKAIRILYEQEKSYN